MEEIFPIFWPYYALALTLSVLLGLVAQRSRFCLQGGLRDWHNLGDSSRLRQFFAAMAFAMLATTLVESLSLTDLSATKPAYRSSQFAWGRYLVGGFIFGFGMVLASGCGFRQLIKSGEGSLKALWLISIMAITIFWLTRTTFFGVYVLPSFAPLTVALDSQQDIGSLFFSDDGLSARFAISAGLCTLVAWQLQKHNATVGTWLASIGIGIAIALGFALTGGDYAAGLAEEAEFMSTPPYGLGSQSFTVSAPLGDVVYFLDQLSVSQITFGVLAVFGVLLGSALSAVSSKRFSITGFESRKDFGVATLGAVLAAFGAVLAMGCSVGHGITGIATLSAGSFIATAAIAAGGLGAIKLMQPAKQ